MLELKNISCSYGRMPVVRNLTLDIEEGSTGLFGPNGAGKTTIINAILGLVPLKTGSISFRGTELNKLKTHERVHLGISVVPQERELFPFMTVYENLIVGGQNVPSARDRVARTLEEVCEIFPILKERFEQKAGTMSGGQQRQLAVGRALMARPKLLILDEPSLGLQPSIVHDLFSILKDMKKDVSIMVTEQNVRESLRAVDTGHIMENGEIIITGTADELSNNPEVEKAYMGL
ncbi:MAG: ABC transporter ATP-binding protein [Spirochaetales bacterium]|nr:ABC transporter ATP-binding protein [Spirochaetales bacterium]